MKFEQGQYTLDYLFNKFCKEKRYCSIPIDYEKIFSKECHNILRDRWERYYKYGKDEAFAII